MVGSTNLVEFGPHLSWWRLWSFLGDGDYGPFWLMEVMVVFGWWRLWPFMVDGGYDPFWLEVMTLLVDGGYGPVSLVEVMTLFGWWRLWPFWLMEVMSIFGWWRLCPFWLMEVRNLYGWWRLCPFSVDGSYDSFLFNGGYDPFWVWLFLIDEVVVLFTSWTKGPL